MFHKDLIFPLNLVGWPSVSLSFTYSLIHSITHTNTHTHTNCISACLFEQYLFSTLAMLHLCQQPISASSFRILGLIVESLKALCNYCIKAKIEEAYTQAVLKCYCRQFYNFQRAHYGDTSQFCR